MPARAHQLFTKFSDVQIYKLSRPFILAADEVILDHLGVFLARKLLQVDVQSGSKKIIPAEVIAEMKRPAIEAEEAEDMEELNGLVTSSVQPSQK